jgi:hypothetical protein
MENLNKKKSAERIFPTIPLDAEVETIRRIISSAKDIFILSNIELKLSEKMKQDPRIQAEINHRRNILLKK